jgi:hypothetical protein
LRKGIYEGATVERQTHLNAIEFPSKGQMLKDQLKATTQAESREAMIERYLKDL